MIVAALLMDTNAFKQNIFMYFCHGLFFAIKLLWNLKLTQKNVFERQMNKCFVFRFTRISQPFSKPWMTTQSKGRNENSGHSPAWSSSWLDIWPRNWRRPECSSGTVSVYVVITDMQLSKLHCFYLWQNVHFLLDVFLSIRR